MSDFDTFPNAEAVVADALRAVLTCGVYSSVPKGPTIPFVRVQRIGGLPVERHRLDRARLQVSAWGRDQGKAYDLAAATRVACLDLEGTQTGGAVITAVDDALGLTYALDPETGRDRYVFAVDVYLHIDDSASS